MRMLENVENDEFNHKKPEVVIETILWFVKFIMERMMRIELT